MCAIADARRVKPDAMRAGWAVYVLGPCVDGVHAWQRIDASLYFDADHVALWWRLNRCRWPEDVVYQIAPALVPLH